MFRIKKEGAFIKFLDFLRGAYSRGAFKKRGLLIEVLRYIFLNLLHPRSFFSSEAVSKNILGDEVVVDSFE